MVNIVYNGKLYLLLIRCKQEFAMRRVHPVHMVLPFLSSTWRLLYNKPTGLAFTKFLETNRALSQAPFLPLPLSTLSLPLSFSLASRWRCCYYSSYHRRCRGLLLHPPHQSPQWLSFDVAQGATVFFSFVGIVWATANMMAPSFGPFMWGHMKMADWQALRDDAVETAKLELAKKLRKEAAERLSRAEALENPNGDNQPNNSGGAGGAKFLVSFCYLPYYLSILYPYANIVLDFRASGPETRLGGWEVSGSAVEGEGSCPCPATWGVKW
ncbi:hypothetical protein F5884DRAFT_554438 [Xylogone sp. PMI_703]|nr:hypothetical protein F5884DRAFT_554438 [Xylogone sp. PMI_703]